MAAGNPAAAGGWWGGAAVKAREQWAEAGRMLFLGSIVGYR